MLHPARPTPAQVEPWPTLAAAVQRPEVTAALQSLYDDFDSHIAAGPARCEGSGRCCHFEAYGHRLYVTGLEVAWFRHRLAGQSPARPGEQAAQPAPDTGGLASGETTIALPLLGEPTTMAAPGCPFQHDRQCTVHPIRPMGCRIYFCQEGTEQWQQSLYEAFQTQLRDLHEQHRLPYLYLEWRQGLAETSP